MASLLLVATMAVAQPSEPYVGLDVRGNLHVNSTAATTAYIDGVDVVALEAIVRDQSQEILALRAELRAAVAGLTVGPTPWSTVAPTAAPTAPPTASPTVTFRVAPSTNAANINTFSAAVDGVNFDFCKLGPRELSTRLGSV
jgi:hypothetical protein